MDVTVELKRTRKEVLDTLVGLRRRYQSWRLKLAIC